MYSVKVDVQMGQTIREWTKQNLSNAAFKNLAGYSLLEAYHTPSNFLKAVFHKFYFVHS